MLVQAFFVQAGVSMQVGSVLIAVWWMQGCAGRRCREPSVNASGHTAPNTPDLFRTPQLTDAGPGQY
jgi:hypothetical protein